MADYKFLKTIDSGLNEITFDNVVVNGSNMNCVVYNGVIRFGKMPTISIYALTYDSSNDEIEIELNAPSLNWNTGSWTVKAEINDSTPDNTVGSLNANNTSRSLFTISNVRTTYGTGTKTVYVRLYYNGVYSGTVSSTVNVTAATRSWVYIVSHSSPFSGEVGVSGSYSGDWTEGLEDLESTYPANNYNVGDIGVANDYPNDLWFEFEVQ